METILNNLFFRSFLILSKILARVSLQMPFSMQLTHCFVARFAAKKLLKSLKACATVMDCLQIALIIVVAVWPIKRCRNLRVRRKLIFSKHFTNKISHFGEKIIYQIKFYWNALVWERRFTRHSHQQSQHCCQAIPVLCVKWSTVVCTAMSLAGKFR